MSAETIYWHNCYEDMQRQRDEIIAAIRQEFALKDGEGLMEFIHMLGGRMRKLENALDSIQYDCPECGSPDVRATVLDGKMGAVFVDPYCGCGDGIEDRVAAAAMERWRLAQILGGDV